MAVLIEAISVVCRVKTISRVMTWEDFVQLVPNQTLCSDNEIARVGFMHPDDVRTFIGILQNKGLRFSEDGKDNDIAVIDQQRGATIPTHWLEVGTIPFQSGTIVAARLKDSHGTQLFFPDGWTFGGSLSQTFGFIANEQVSGFNIENGSDAMGEVRRSGSALLGFIGRALE